MRIALATAAAQRGFHASDLPLVHALPRIGATPESCVWNDPAVAWEAYDAVLVRTVWDYFHHYGAFLAWLGRLEQGGVPVLNPVPMLRWNADKRYLLELEHLGVPAIPTRLATHAELPGEVAAAGWPEVVVKPRVSAGAWHTLSARADDPALAGALAALPDTLEYLVQPLRREVAHAGEWSLVYFGGHYSHARLKRPAAGDFRVQEHLGGSIVLAEPPREYIDQGEVALAALAPLALGRATYARVDAVPVGGRLEVMELELIEPNLFLDRDPASGLRFARAIDAALRRGGGRDSVSL